MHIYMNLQTVLDPQKPAASLKNQEPQNSIHCLDMHAHWTEMEGASAAHLRVQ